MFFAKMERIARWACTRRSIHDCDVHRHSRSRLSELGSLIRRMLRFRLLPPARVYDNADDDCSMRFEPSVKLVLDSDQYSSHA